MKQTGFDKYLKEQLKDKEFAERFRHAGEAWDVSLKIAALRGVTTKKTRGRCRREE
jgi:hypothetical protein